MLEIERNVVNDYIGRAYQAQRVITGPEIRGPVSYMTMLHEIGHILAADLDLGILEEEAWCWGWALGANQFKLTPKTLGALKRKFDTYLGGCSPDEDTIVWPVWRKLSTAQ